MLTMLESLNYSFRNPKTHNLSNLPHQTVEKLQKNHGVLRGTQLDKQRWWARLGILRVNTVYAYHLIYTASTCFDNIISPSSESWHQNSFKIHSTKLGHNKHTQLWYQQCRIVQGVVKNCVRKYSIVLVILQ